MGILFLAMRQLRLMSIFTPPGGRQPVARQHPPAPSASAAPSSTMMRPARKLRTLLVSRSRMQSGYTARPLWRHACHLGCTTVISRCTFAATRGAVWCLTSDSAPPTTMRRMRTTTTTALELAVWTTLSCSRETSFHVLQEPLLMFPRPWPHPPRPRRWCRTSGGPIGATWFLT